jgi:hypothetical protein
LGPICHGEPKIREESFASRKFGLPMWRLRSGLNGAGAPAPCAARPRLSIGGVLVTLKGKWGDSAALSSSRDQSAVFRGNSPSNSLK